MSGGSYEYFYRSVDDMAKRIVIEKRTPERLAFSRHLEKIANALQAIEWVDSCDYGPVDENKAIMECIKPAEVVTVAAEMLANEITRAQLVFKKFAK